MVNLSADDPSVAIFANKIANSTVTCNATEVEQLVVLEVQVNKLAADITIQFTAVQVVIQGKIDARKISYFIPFLLFFLM